MELLFIIKKHVLIIKSNVKKKEIFDGIFLTMKKYSYKLNDKKSEKKIFIINAKDSPFKIIPNNRNNSE